MNRIQSDARWLVSGELRNGEFVPRSHVAIIVDAPGTDGKRGSKCFLATTDDQTPRSAYLERHNPRGACFGSFDCTEGFRISAHRAIEYHQPVVARVDDKQV